MEHLDQVTRRRGQKTTAEENLNSGGEAELVTQVTAGLRQTDFNVQKFVFLPSNMDVTAGIVFLFDSYSVLLKTRG